MVNRAYGLTAEVNNKIAANYDKGLESELRSWISSTVGEPVTGDFQEALKSGVILCKLANKLAPGSIRKINTSKLPFSLMENIEAFLNVCAQNFKLSQHELFMTVDLWENKNMTQVLTTLAALRRSATGVLSASSKPGNQVFAPDYSEPAAPASRPAASRPAAAPAASAGPKFCPNCGTATNGAKFCSNCGNKL